jgi:hypothetical protein
MVCEETKTVIVNVVPTRLYEKKRKKTKSTNRHVKKVQSNLYAKSAILYIKR